MPFGMITRMSPRNHVLDGGADPQENGQHWGEVAVYCKLQGHSTMSCANRLDWSRCHLGEDSGGPKQPCIRRGLDPPWEGAFLRGVCPIGKHGSSQLLKNGLVLTFAEYMNRKLSASAVHMYSLLGDRYLHLQEISDINLLFQFSLQTVAGRH